MTVNIDVRCQNVICMPRSLDRTKIKDVVDALKKRNLSWSELKEITNIPDKSLERILKDYLSFWGLIRKVKDEKDREKWAWIENVKVYRTVREFDLDLNHSKKIVPAIDAILGEDRMLWPTNIREHEFKEFLLQHLETEYRDIYGLVLNLRGILGEWDRYLEEIGAKYHMEIDNWVSESARALGHDSISPAHFERWRGQWQEKFGRAILTEVFGIPIRVSHSMLHILEFLPDEAKDYATAIQGKRCQIFEDLNSELSKLRSRVNMGRPLDGRCGLCPRVRIEPKTKS